VLLAEQARVLLRPAAVVVELCCGVGAVAAVLQGTGLLAELLASDIDPAAARYARRNLAFPAAVLVGDLYDPLPGRLRGRVDVLAANAPYVPTEEIALMPREAREHEPELALDGGRDGCDVHRRIVRQARDWLAPGGWLLIETGREQSAVTAAAMTAAGLTPEVVTDDERDATVVAGVAEP
jgi:release factor glutamine methyltransferase